MRSWRGSIFGNPSLFVFSSRPRRPYALDCPQIKGRLVDMKLPIEPPIFDEGRDGTLDPGEKLRLGRLRGELARNMIHMDPDKIPSGLAANVERVLWNFLKDYRDIEFW
jgi:hypothetical protein